MGVMRSSVCGLLASSLLLGASAEARDWRAPEPWPSAAPKVLVIGDSNVYGPIGDVLQAGLVGGGYAVWRRGKPSTGLARPDHYDWLAEARQMIDDVHPSVVITQFGGNDVLVLRWRDDKKRRIFFSDEEAWRTAYGERVRDFLTLLEDDGRRVFLLSPTNRGIGLARVERVREVQREVAAELPRVTFIDMFPLTSDDHGHWLRAIEKDGHRVVVRRWDTVHFNDAGGLLIGGRVLEQLRAAGLPVTSGGYQ